MPWTVTSRQVFARQARLPTERAVELLAYYVGFAARDRLEVTITVAAKPAPKSNPS